jgi:hypothetical protein
MNTGQAVETDRKPGDVEQRLAADAAIGRKKNREEALGNAARPDSVDPGAAEPNSSLAGRLARNNLRGNNLVRSNLGGNNQPPNNRRPRSCDTGLASPDLVLTTAEDGLLVNPAGTNATRSIVSTSTAV